MKSKTLCSICHDVIETQHVFTENNQVFLRKNIKGTSPMELDDWHPINFQWIAVVRLNEHINSSF